MPCSKNKAEKALKILQSFRPFACEDLPEYASTKGTKDIPRSWATIWLNAEELPKVKAAFDAEKIPMPIQGEELADQQAGGGEPAKLDPRLFFKAADGHKRVRFIPVREGNSVV